MPPDPLLATRAFEISDTQRLEEILLLNWGTRAGRSQYDGFFAVQPDDPVPSGVTLVAELAGRVVGFGMIGQHEWHASAAMLGINVNPSFRTCGVGKALYDALLETWTRLHGPRPVRAVASEAQPDARRFLERRGFREDNRTHLPVLEFANVDEAAFQKFAERLEQRGISVRSLSSLSDDPDHEMKAASLFGTVYTAAHKVNTVSNVPLEDWLEELHEFQADGVIIAVKDGEYIGFGALAEGEKLNGPTGFFYGTLESYPDQSLEIALAIVVAQVRVLQARGLKRLHFEVDSDDAHGMALIATLPVTPQPAFVTFLRPLETIRAE